MTEAAGDAFVDYLIKPIEEEVWYRFEDMRWAAPLDEFDEPVGKGRADVILREFPVLSHTPKGVRLRTFDGHPRLVLHHWRKKFACSTVELAKENFLARKAAQRRILCNQLQHVEDALKVFDKKFGGDDDSS